MAVRTPLKVGTNNNPQQMSTAEIAAVQAYCQYLYFEKWWRFNGGVQLVVDYRANKNKAGRVGQSALNTLHSRYATRNALTDSYRLAGTTNHSVSSFASVNDNSSIQTWASNDFLFQITDDVTSQAHTTLSNTSNNWTYPLYYDSGNLKAMTSGDVYDTFIYPAITGSGSSVSTLHGNGNFYTVTDSSNAPSGYNTAPIFDVIEGGNQVQTNLGNVSGGDYQGHVSGGTGGTQFAGSSGAYGSNHSVDSKSYGHYSGSGWYSQIFHDKYMAVAGELNPWDTGGASAAHLYSIIGTGSYNKSFTEWQQESPRGLVDGIRDGTNYYLYRRNSNPFSTTSSVLPLVTITTGAAQGNLRTIDSTSWKTVLENMMCYATSNIASNRLDFNYSPMSGTQQGTAILNKARAAGLLQYERDVDNYLSGYVPNGTPTTQNTYYLNARIY
tara:strand:- start:45 stop:1364 length:1320 start_codon:yes stop_codon:yes gene_type:complete